MLLGLAAGALVATAAAAEEIGEARTTFKMLNANDKIVIEAFDDPDIPGATSSKIGRASCRERV